MFLRQDVAPLPSSVTWGDCLLGFCHPNHQQLKRCLYADRGEDVGRFLALCQCKAPYLLESNARLGCTSDLKLLNSSLLTLKKPFRGPLGPMCASAEDCPDHISTTVLPRLRVQ